MATISTRIKQVIKNQGLTQKEVAHKMGISPQTFSDKLNRHDNFTINFLLGLNQALSGALDYNYILSGEKKESTQKSVVDYEFLIGVLQEKIQRLEGKFRGIDILLPRVA